MIIRKLIFTALMMYCHAALISQRDISTDSLLQIKDAKRLTDDCAFERLYLKSPGISVSRSSGSPEDPLFIRIRCINTLQRDMDPLIVVNGMPGYPASLLRPENIRHIRVLKTAAQSSYCGIKGGKGVI